MQPIDDKSSPSALGSQYRTKSRRRGRLIVAALCLLLASGTAVVASYYMSLRPVDRFDQSLHTVVIKSGSTPQAIADQLKNANLIRSAWAFQLSAKLQRVEGALQAGEFKLSKSQSTPDIIQLLHSGGETKTFNVTFLPGGTLRDARQVLGLAGYSSSEIDGAFAKHYEFDVLADRPPGASLEGFFYGETHQFNEATSASQVLEKFFTSFDDFAKNNNLRAVYKKRDLTLYQGIILASIIEREATPGDEAAIAQVFLKRIKEGVQLGSDPTAIYGAEKDGVDMPSGDANAGRAVAIAINHDSPYNTRMHNGLPPGPIATPGKNALLAVANPAKGDFMYFVHGDDGKIHLSRSLAEHEAKTAKYCTKLC